MKKRLLACILAGAMAVSTASIAFAEDPPAPSAESGTAFGTVTPNVTTEAQGAIVNFSVPTTMNVGLDPFQAGDKSGSQIYSLDQGIYNKSNIPIRVVVKAGVIVSDDVTLKTGAGDVDSTDITNTDKDAYVELVAQPATATSDRSGAIVVTATKAEGKDYAVEYKTTGDSLGAATDAKTALTAIDDADAVPVNAVSFALQAATYAADRSGELAFSEMAANNKGIGSFRFMGSLNANADNWTGDDLSVKVVYDVNGMGTAAYDALMGGTGSATATQKAVNVYSVADVAAGGQTPPSGGPSVDTGASTNMSLTKNAGGAYYDADPTIVIDYGTWTPTGNVTAAITTAAYNGDNAGTETFTDTTDYSWNATTKTLTVQGAATKGIAKQAADASVTTWTLTITLTDDGDNSTKTVTATITVDNN